METQELTQIVTAHQNAIARSETRLDRIEAILERVAQRQEQSESRIDAINATLDLVAQQQTVNAQQIAINQEAIANLNASILDLRNVVADYIQSRTKTE